MTGSRHVWLNGQIVPWDAPLLTVTDRGFQLGDGVFETLRARRAVLVEWREHCERLHDSAAALDIHLPYDDDVLVAGVLALLAAEGLSGSGSEPGSEPGDAALRITISRGSDLGAIALVCLIGYAQLRFPEIDWLSSRPETKGLLG